MRKITFFASADEKTVFKIISQESCTTYELSYKTQFAIPKLNSILTMLEIKMVIRKNAYGYWESI